MKLKPFDNSMNEDFSMYDRLPYVKDVDLCGPDKIGMASGNVIKFFQYTVEDTYQITGIDDLYQEKLALHEKEKNKAEEEKNALHRLADELMPDDGIETVENPQLAESATEDVSATSSDSAAEESPTESELHIDPAWALDDDWG